jgi:hypothetical protein
MAFTLKLLKGSKMNDFESLDDLMVEEQEEFYQGDAKKEKDGCFVATVIYGDPFAPQVNAMRRYRDTVLRATWWGRWFIRCYYGGLGEWLARQLRERDGIAVQGMRWICDRVVDLGVER